MLNQSRPNVGWQRVALVSVDVCLVFRVRLAMPPSVGLGLCEAFPLSPTLSW